MNKTFSDKGKERLKKLEGFSAKAYLDSAGKKTIGYGHVIVSGDGVAPGDIINDIKATELLERDVASAVRAVNTGVTNNEVTQNQFDAMVIFAYNVGNYAFLSSSLLRRVNENNMEAAANEFPKWCKVRTKQGAFVELAGLKNRREAEQNLFLEV